MAAIEVLLAVLQNVSFVAFLFALAVCLYVVIGTAGASVDADEFTFAKGMKIWLPLLIVLALIAAIPGPEQVWRIRLSLLKLNIASEKNVDRAVDHLDQLVQALECRYMKVNCPKEDRK